MNNKFENWRTQIDIIDQNILALLAKRMGIVRKIGQFKKEHNISTFDQKRWQQILKANIKKGEGMGLPKEFIKSLLQLIHNNSLKLQKKS